MRKLKRSLRKLVNFLILVAIVSIAALFAIARIFESSSRYYLWLIPAIIVAFLTFKALKFAFFRSSRYLNNQGYVVLRRTNELEHRALAVDLLGRELSSNEVVHHINGKRADNRVTNLCLMDREKHEHFHSWLRWKKDKGGHYPTIKKQKRILREEYGGTLLEEINNSQLMWLAEPSQNIEPSPKRTSGSISPVIPRTQYNKPIVQNENQKRLLFVILRDERKRISEIFKIPAYEIFVDKSLLQMAEEAPISRHEMLHIEGVTGEKYEAYGSYFIEVIRGFKVGLETEKRTRDQ